MGHGFHTHKGHATEEGTARFAARLTGAAADFFSHAGSLSISSVGLGTYLGPYDAATDDAYVAAIRRAVALGVNHIDTAVNYRFQRSERNVGEALEQLLHAKECKRDEVLVATKAGYVPFDGAPPRDVAAWVAAEIVGKGLARPEEIVAGCHCLAPTYLAGMLKQSLHNLRLDTVDVLYLHNPEQQLGAVDRGTFLARMRAAFAFLEEQVAAGTVRAYGTATWNGYRAPEDAAGHLVLEELVGIAREVAGEGHHFRFLQLPYNLVMTEAARVPNQRLSGATVTVLDAARALGVHVTCSASLAQATLTRGLPEAVAVALPGLETDGQRSLQFVRSTPGVMTALAGMSSVAHVEENLGLRRVLRAEASALERL